MLIINLGLYGILPAILFLGFARISNMFRYIPNSGVGIVEKLFSRKGSVKSGFIALKKEVGYQPEILRGGLHVMFPFCYRIHSEDLVTVGQGQMAYVFARDGKPLEAAQTLASNDTEDKSNFQNTRTFLEGGGQRGPQRKILREGTHAINLAQFAIITKEKVYGLALSKNEQTLLENMKTAIAERKGFTPIVIKDNDDMVGVVTVHEGPALPPGEIIAPEVGTAANEADTFHNNFQDPEKFLLAGGNRGRQLQVIVEGTYYINRLFATVEPIAKTTIEVGTVGVVVFYTGKKGADVSGEDYRHGELVENGCKGVWKDPLLPGKYAFNTFAGKVERIPTVNFILKWMKGESGGMKLDENLSEVSLITKDAFEPTLPLSVVMHIDYKKAPMIVQRFGDPKKLVEQTLDPMVSAYFKNVGQTMTLIELLQKRAEIQSTSSNEMKEKFNSYNLELQEVLIGTPKAAGGDQTIEKILIQLRDRQVAREQVETYQEQGKAATQERVLNEARATAEMQTALTQSKVKVTVAENEGSAAVALANKEAEKIQLLAKANAERTIQEGRGEASRIEAVGTANAEATKKQVDAYGGPSYRLSEITFSNLFNAIREGKQAVVPHTLVVNGSGSEQGGLIPNGLISGALATLMPRLENIGEKEEKERKVA